MSSRGSSPAPTPSGAMVREAIFIFPLLRVLYQYSSASTARTIVTDSVTTWEMPLALRMVMYSAGRSREMLRLSWSRSAS